VLDSVPSAERYTDEAYPVGDSSYCPIGELAGEEAENEEGEEGYPGDKQLTCSCFHEVPQIERLAPDGHPLGSGPYR